MFSHLPRLEVLRLNINRLGEIPYDTFDDLTQLTDLDISNNSLKTVTHTMFSHLSRLNALDLSNSTFETIPDDAFVGLGQLISLRLDNCGLSTLRPPLLRTMSNVFMLFLSFNPLVCDCQLAWVMTAALWVHGSCTNPPSARGQQVQYYDFSQCNQENTGNGCTYLKSPLLYMAQFNK